MVKWCDAREKGSAAEVLLLEAMSSEESSYEDGEGEPKLVGYSVKRLSWESRSLRKQRKNLVRHTTIPSQRGQETESFLEMLQRNFLNVSHLLKVSRVGC